MQIGIDLMGSEKSPQEHFSAILQILPLLSSTRTIVVFATEAIIEELSDLIPFPMRKHVAFHPVVEVIAMEDNPLVAVRNKKNSSLTVGIQCIQEKEIDAFITAGNTGALIASCLFSLPLLPGIKRPVLLATLPAKSGPLAVVDVGGHLSSKPFHLVQCALMGAAYQRIAKGVDKPTIGLLNIGTESGKGTLEIREAHQLLMEECPKHQCHFIGNVEGRAVFTSSLDVLVTDGFTGNVFLKTAEGISSYIFDCLSAQSKAVDTQIESVRKQFSPIHHPGALVCGVDGLVIKCHGASTAEEFLSSYKAATSFLQQNLLEKIKMELFTE